MTNIDFLCAIFPLFCSIDTMQQTKMWLIWTLVTPDSINPWKKETWKPTRKKNSRNLMKMFWNLSVSNTQIDVFLTLNLQFVHGSPPGSCSLVGLWKIYLCLFIPNSTRNHVITYTSAVPRGGAGRTCAPPPPPVFFPLKIKTDLYKMLKIKYQATVWEVFKKWTADEVYVCL